MSTDSGSLRARAETSAWGDGPAEAGRPPQPRSQQPTAPPAVPHERLWRQRLPAWYRAVMLTLGVTMSTGAGVLFGASIGMRVREAVILSLPIGATIGFLMSLLLIVIPDWRAATARRWLIQCLIDFSRMDRRHRFNELLTSKNDPEISEIARAVHAVLLLTHRDRLEAAQVRRELDARVRRHTRVAVAHLNRLTTTDELTGVSNRRGFDQDYTALFAACRAAGEELSLLAIDMDHFKKLNDSLGHSAGDVALRAAGEVFASSLRDGDLAGRVGGDEFMIALRASHVDEAAIVARRLQDLYARHPASLPFGTKWPSLSIGIAAGLLHGAADAEDLRRRADLALYAAKDSGRGQSRIWEASIETLPPRRSAA